MAVPDYLIGCIMGRRGIIKKEICDRARVEMLYSDRNGNAYRDIKIDGTIDAISMAVNMINER